MKKSFSILFILVLVVSFSLVAAVPVAAATAIYVNDSTGNDAWNGEAATWISGIIGPKATIAAGIGIVDPGGIVNVAAGTYNVTSVINVNVANLTISGASATNTFVDGSGKNASIVDGADVLFNVTADGVTIENLTIDLGDDTTDFDVGVLTPNGGGFDNLTVQNCIFEYAAFGLFPGEQSIHLGGGAGVTITGNTFEAASGNSVLYVGENVAGGGNDSLTVSNNTVAPGSDTDGGGTFFNQMGPVTNSTISGNTFTDTGIAVYLGAGSTATNNITVVGNTFDSTSGFGPYGALVITSEVDGVATSNIVVTCNTFKGTQAAGAITIFDSNLTTSDVDGSTITINYNNFVGNIGGGVVVGAGVSGTPVDAQYNWWGDVSGPSGPGGIGSGDGVSANVDYDPWSLTPDPCETKTIGFWKTHPGSTLVVYGLGPLVLGSDAVSYAEVMLILKNAKAKNAYDMLAAQLIAAKLNKLHLDRLFIDSTDFDPPIDAADAFLIAQSWENGDLKPPKALKAAVNALKDALDDVNNTGCFCAVCST